MPADAQALKQIKALLGPAGVVEDEQAMAPYLVSWRNNWRGTTPFIALPNTTAQVVEIAKLCHAAQIPIVPQGGNTGLVGGNIPSTDGGELVVNLSRLNKIRGIDATGSCVTAEAGVVLQKLQEAADAAGFLFPLSMASEGSCEIGGAISTNAGGTAVLRYGNMRDLVLGLEVVLPDGSLFSGLRSLRKDNMGYNLNHYFIGAEGTLGIVTAAALKLFPKPQQTLTAMAAVKNVATALELLQRFKAACGEFLTTFEIISLAALQLVVRHIPGSRFPGREDAPFYLLIELASSGTAMPLRAAFEEIMGAALEEGRALDAVIAESAAQGKQFWSLREHCSEALRKEGVGLHFDIALPLAELPDFFAAAGAKVRAIAPDILIAPFGHLGDGNIHYNMRFQIPPGDEKFARLKAQIEDAVYGEVMHRGGSFSAEHGIGRTRIHDLTHYRAAPDVELMRKIKRALDPDNLMNPGKVVG